MCRLQGFREMWTQGFSRTMASSLTGGGHLTLWWTGLVNQPRKFHSLKSVAGHKVWPLISTDDVQNAIDAIDPIRSAQSKVDRVGNAIGLAIKEVVQRAVAVSALVDLTANAKYDQIP